MADMLDRFPDAKRDGAGHAARCPAHDDRRASLSIGRGDDGRVLLHCHAGCTLDAILAAVNLTPADLFPEKTATTKSKIVAEYHYHDEGGKHLFDVVRFEPKDFKQRRADGVWKMDGVRRVVYRLNELQGKSVVYICEGEKDCDRLWAKALPATTNPGGASKGDTSKWKPEYAQQLVAAAVEQVAIFPDNDEPGRKHAEHVAKSCAAAGLTVKIVTVPGVPDKGDVSDWLDAGHTRADLVALVKAAPEYTAIQPPQVNATATLPTVTMALTSIGDLLAEPDERVDYIVDGCLAAGSINLLSAKPKVGKSTAGRHLALEVARGGEWLGRKCRQGAVWYLAFEGRRADIRNHFRQMGATPADALRVFTGQAPSAVIRQLRDLAVHERPTLIEIDTMQRFIRAKSTDDYAEMTTLLDDVIAIARDSDAAILLLHHSNKSGRAGIDAVLGSTAICGSMDTVFLMGKSDRYRTISTEQRTGQDMPEHVIVLDAETGRVSLAGSRADADRDAVAGAMITALQDSEPLTQADLETRIEGRTALKRAALKRALEMGRVIVAAGTGKKGDPYFYAVAGSCSVVPPNGWEQENKLFELPVTPTAHNRNACSHVPSPIREQAEQRTREVQEL